ncbi:hypothetical protein HanPI659440_Chr12g0448911 [Helianthus annuus]|nr:hypothetical protein HanPI659440_Chr12g0448911 [Helianthus annuus]
MDPNHINPNNQTLNYKSPLNTNSSSDPSKLLGSWKRRRIWGSTDHIWAESLLFLMCPFKRYTYKLYFL